MPQTYLSKTLRRTNDLEREQELESGGGTRRMNFGLESRTLQSWSVAAEVERGSNNKMSS